MGKIANISETLRIGCNICIKKCPFEAISIINLPANLESETAHRYGGNSFKLHRLSTPRPGQVLGLVGTSHFLPFLTILTIFDHSRPFLVIFIEIFGHNLSKMVKNDQMWSKMVKNVQKWSNVVKMAKNVQK